MKEGVAILFLDTLYFSFFEILIKLKELGAYLEPSQTSKMESLLQKQLMAFSRCKAPPQMFEWILNAPLELARNAYLLTRILMLTANSNYGWIVYLITPQIDCLCMIFYHKFCKDMKVCHKWILLFFMSDDSLSSLFVFLNFHLLVSQQPAFLWIPFEDF